MLNKRQIFVTFIFCLIMMIIVPVTFAESMDDNQTVMINQDDDVIKGGNDYYFDASLDNDEGDGSINNPFKKLTADRIKNSSNIYLAKGEYYLDRRCDIDNQMNIIGEDSSNTVIKYNFRLFNVTGYLSLNDVALDNASILNYGEIYAKNVVFRNGEGVKYNNGESYGGAIFTYPNTDSKVTIVNCTFNDNFATHGGAICMDSGILEVYDSTFINNYAYEYGGAISCENSPRVVISNSKFTKNRAIDSRGGAVYIENCYNFTTSHSTFKDSSSLYGGAIWVSNANLWLSDMTFENNTAYNFGGAIAVLDCGLVDFSNSNFNKNDALEDAGGAIYIMSSNYFKANNINITASHARNGAAITSLNTTTVIDNLNARGNVAELRGGAIYQMYCGIDLRNSEFTSNTALNGGALFIDNSTLILIHNSFADNTAIISAGALYSLFNNLAYNYSNTFNNNHASYYNDVFENYELDMEILSRDYLLFKLTDIQENLSANYSMLDEGYLTPVKNQGDAGNCWAFTAMAVLESCIKKITGEEFDFSEENLKNLMAFFSDYGQNSKTNDGGTPSMAHGYFASWLGPVNDSDDAYSEYSVLSEIYDSILHVQNILFLSRDTFTDNDEVKRAIIKYGAVGSSLFYDDSFLKNASYFVDQNIKSDHAVTIVGWDDNYSRYNFRSIPEGDGAWLVKNSWGSDWGDNGYFYVSYYDRTLMEPGSYNEGYTFILNDTIRLHKNYQYDIAGRTSSLIYNLSNILYKNAFRASDDEMLAAVSTYFIYPTSWTVNVYVNDVLKTSKSGFSVPGYWTIFLDDMIHLNKGDVFEVVFNITADGMVRIPVASNDESNKPVLANLSKVSTNGVYWWNMSETEVACIKAFTIVDDINTTLSLDIIYDNYNPVNVTARVADVYGNPLNGKVTFNINGNEVVVDLVGGMVSFVDNFEKGVNVISCLFNKTGYAVAFNQTSFEVSKRNTQLSLDIERKVNNLFIEISSGDNLNEKVVLYIDNTNCTFTLKDGYAAYNMTGLENGVYSFRAVLISQYWDAEDVSKSIEVNIKNTQIIAGDMTVNDEAISNFTFTLADEDGNALPYKAITIGNDTVFTDGEGVVSIPINVGRGKYSITMAFEGDNDYFATQSTKHITVLTNVEAQIAVNTYRDNANITVEFSKPINESIILTLNSNATQYMLNNGKFKISLSNLANGFYNVSVDLSDDYFNFTQAKSDFTIRFIKTRIIADDFTTTDLSGENYTIQLVDSSDNPLFAKQIKFTLNGNVDYAYTDSNGVVSIPINLNGGTYPITISYSNASDCYDDCEITRNIHVTKSLTVDFDLEGYQNNVAINMTFSRPITLNAFVAVNAVLQPLVIENGQATLKLNNLANGRYDVEIVLSNDYALDNDTFTFTVLVEHTRIIAEVQNICYHSGPLAYIYLVDENNNPLANKTLYFHINEKDYHSFTNKNGAVPLDLNQLFVGEYPISITFNGDDDYFASKNSTVFNVISSIALPQNKYTFNSPYIVTFYDKDGPLNQKEVSVVFNGMLYNLTTDTNGQASLKINLDVGSYSLRITNPQTGEVKTQVIQVVARLSGNANIAMYYGAGKSYTVRAFTDNGQVAGAGEIVTFKVAGKAYNVKTDRNGYASFKVTLKSGTYTITATYNGFIVTNKITVKPTLITKDKKAKKGKNIKYEAKLLNTNGKALKGKKITFKIKGKTYKAKTNKKGIAKITIKKGLKVGKYTITAKYGKLTSTSKITVKK